MFDTDKFIELIQNNNAIWETGLKEYKDTIAKNNCWNEIGGTMYPNWIDLDQLKKDDLSKYLCMLFLFDVYK